MNQRQAIVLAMRFRPRAVRRRTWARLTVSIYDPICLAIWRIRNPRMAWFAVRVDLHYRWGFPLPPLPPYRIAA